MFTPKAYEPAWDVVLWEEQEGIRIQGVSDSGNRFIRRLKGRNLGRPINSLELHTMLIADDETEDVMEAIDVEGIRTRTL